MTRQKPNSLENVTWLNWEKKHISWKGLLHLLLKRKICTFYHKVFHLFVFSHVSVVTVRTGDDLLWTVSIQMFLQKSFLKFSSAVILAKDFSVLTIHIHMFLKPKHTKGWILPLNLLHWTSFFLLYRDEWRLFFFISALLLVEVPLLEGNSILSVALTSLQRSSLTFWAQTLVFMNQVRSLGSCPPTPPPPPNSTVTFASYSGQNVRGGVGGHFQRKLNWSVFIMDEQERVLLWLKVFPQRRSFSRKISLENKWQ